MINTFGIVNHSILINKLDFTVSEIPQTRDVLFMTVERVVTKNNINDNIY